MKIHQAGAKPELGQVIPVGKFITTAQGKANLTLSNGTLVTLEESTKMQVGKFEQAPSMAPGKVSDLAVSPDFRSGTGTRHGIID